jgi:hypothetical protein
MVSNANQLVDPIVGIWDVIRTLRTTLALYWTLMNFTLAKFKKLVTLVLPIIINHVKSTKEVCRFYGQPCKLTLEQCLLNFILYFKHDNSTWHNHVELVQKSICNNVLFTLSRINEVMQIRSNGWLSRKGLPWQGWSKNFRVSSNALIKPWWRSTSCEIMWHIGLGSIVGKKLYSMNNTIIVDNQGLFITLTLNTRGHTTM